MQPPALAESSRQVKVAPAAVEWNVNEAVVDVVRAAGPLSMIVSGIGGVLVTTLLLGAELLPAPSWACTV